MRHDRIFLNDLGIVCALGKGKPEVAERLLAGDTSGLIRTDAYSPGKLLTVGAVCRALVPLAPPRPRHDSRNNRLLLCALEEIHDSILALRERISPRRFAVVLGTSTSGIFEGEQAVARLRQRGSLPAGFHYGQQEIGSPAEFLADMLGLSGPQYTVSTACSSSLKALASATRLLRLGICDAVLAGGVDTLCRFTIAGFSALEAVSPEPCNPFSANRCGINIGEGAAVFIVSREPGEIALLGAGESSDGYHVSAPDPSGRGVKHAMRLALQEADLTPERIDYLNLHGTATVQNDAMEAHAVQSTFPDGIACSSTKPLTGHALGAAGAVEAGLSWLTLSSHNARRLLPPHRWDGVADPSLPPLRLVEANAHAPDLRRVMSNSFGFGGSNIAAILGRE